MSIQMKLLAAQQSLKANKTQYNSFGKYNYRSCEDILEALKPVLALNLMFVTLSDEVVEAGGRIYIKATATATDAETFESISVTAFAREEETKKGMDASQVTGAASSYARKYALNGLFAIDDNKDSDSTNTHGKDEMLPKMPNETPEQPAVPKFICEKCGAVLKPYEKNGKTYSIRQHAEGSRKKFGGVYCINCIEKGETNA